MLKTKRTSDALPRTPLFQKKFDPASPGFGLPWLSYMKALRTPSEGLSFRFTLWV